MHSLGACPVILLVVVVVFFFSLYTVDLYCHCFTAFECRSLIDMGGNAAPGESLECTVENSVVLLEREFCPEFVTCTRV